MSKRVHARHAAKSVGRGRHQPPAAPVSVRVKQAVNPGEKEAGRSGEGPVQRGRLGGETCCLCRRSSGSRYRWGISWLQATRISLRTGAVRKHNNGCWRQSHVSAPLPVAPDNQRGSGESVVNPTSQDVFVLTWRVGAGQFLEEVVDAGFWTFCEYLGHYYHWIQFEVRKRLISRSVSRFRKLRLQFHLNVGIENRINSVFDTIKLPTEQQSRDQNRVSGFGWASNCSSRPDFQKSSKMQQWIEHFPAVSDVKITVSSAIRNSPVCSDQDVYMSGAAVYNLTTRWHYILSAGSYRTWNDCKSCDRESSWLTANV